MIFCGETILPGNRKWVQLPVPGAQPLECVCLCGVKPGQTLAVTAGVHGCEYVGVQALRTLARELVPDDMTGNVILLPLANPYGFYAGAKRVIPEDGVNLNGAFPGDRNGSLGQRLAFALEDSLYATVDFLADLHSGDCNEALHPLVFFPTAGKKEGLFRFSESLCGYSADRLGEIPVLAACRHPPDCFCAFYTKYRSAICSIVHRAFSPEYGYNTDKQNTVCVQRTYTV